MTAIFLNNFASIFEDCFNDRNESTCSSSWAGSSLCGSKMGTEALGCWEGRQVERRLLLPHLTPSSFLLPAVFPVFLGQWPVLWEGKLRDTGLGCFRDGVCMCMCSEIMSTGTALHEVSLPNCDPFLCRDVQNVERKCFWESESVPVTPKKDTLLMNRRKYPVCSCYWNHFECSPLVVNISGKMSVFS